MASSSTSLDSQSAEAQAQQRTRQRTSSRMMKTTRRGRPFAKVSVVCWTGNM
jgi:hypothetical protein